MKPDSESIVVSVIECPMGAVFYCDDPALVKVFYGNYMEQHGEELKALNMPQITVRRIVMKREAYEAIPATLESFRLFSSQEAR